MNLLSSRVGKALAVLGLSAMMLTFPLTSFGRDRDDHHSDRGFDRDRGGYHYYPGNDWDSDGGLYWNWGLGGPFWDNYPAYNYQNRTGKIKLEHVSRRDKVYINGSYVGKADALGTIRLRPGSYTLTIKNRGRDVFSQQVYVIRDRTLKLEVRDQSGRLKFEDAASADHVYINGIYEGEVGDIGSIQLPPGSYNVMVKDKGREVFDRDVYLPTRKTLDLYVGDRG